jgi:hypothetical protein
VEKLRWVWLAGWVALLLALALFPRPAEAEVGLVALRTPVAVVLLVCTLGKLLFDTLFYDRHRP